MITVFNGACSCFKALGVLQCTMRNEMRSGAKEFPTDVDPLGEADVYSKWFQLLSFFSWVHMIYKT